MFAQAVNEAVHLSPTHVLVLSVLATAGLVLMWWTFWAYASKTSDSPMTILMSPAFFKTVAVMGVIAATVVLSLAGRLEGNVTGAILSGIVGYVLGTLTTREKRTNGQERERPEEPAAEKPAEFAPNKTSDEHREPEKMENEMPARKQKG